ncbi:hypothetical protein Tco_0130958 [Tanacetum coccineum]
MRDSESLQALLQREGIDVTMFTDWFELDKHDPVARTLTYVGILKYYVWMLLNVVRRVQGFKELMTVNNRICPLFKEACFAYGLLNDDWEWTKATQDMGRKWQTLSKDILHKKRKLFNYPDLQLTNVQICNYCLLESQELLHSYGRSLEASRIYHGLT